MEATTETVAPDVKAERMKAFRACTRFLGQGPALRLSECLTSLAAEAGEDERPDSYGEGALIEDFEREVAQVLGKEAAVFVPSGTMAQQIALRIWSERKGVRTVAFHPTCHLELREQKGYQFLHGLRPRLVGEPTELIALTDLQALTEPVATLLLELPQREIGGLLPSWDDLSAQTAWARERGIAVHMDGARLWESGPFYQRSYAEIADLFDTVYVSFYKGLGGIGGAALAGAVDFINEARVWIRRHGGNLIYLFPYVLAARAGLRSRLETFPARRDRAQSIAAVLREFPEIVVKPDPPHTNMMHVYLRGDRERLLEASTRIAQEHGVGLFRDLMPAEIPGFSKFELTVGETLNLLSDEEIRAHLGHVLESGRG